MKFRHKYSWVQPRTKLVGTHCDKIASVSSKPSLFPCFTILAPTLKTKIPTFYFSPVTMTNIQTVVKTMTVFLPRSILHCWFFGQKPSNRGRGGRNFVLLRIFLWRETRKHMELHNRFVRSSPIRFCSQKLTSK